MMCVDRKMRFLLPLLFVGIERCSREKSVINFGGGMKEKCSMRINAAAIVVLVTVVFFATFSHIISILQ